MADLDEQTLAKLARELAMNIRSYKAVFADYGIDENDYYEIEKNEFYKKVKDHYTIAWNSATSTEDRVRLESLAYYETLMPALTRRALDPNEPLPAATAWAQTLAKTAGMSQEKAATSGMADRFIITINLGSDVEHFNKSIEVNANDIDPGENHGQAVNERSHVAAKQLVRPAGKGEG